MTADSHGNPDGIGLRSSGSQGREHWGRCVATRALGQFVTEMPDRPLYAHVATRNASSIRVLQKCGFHRDHAQEALAPEPEEFVFVLAE